MDNPIVGVRFLGPQTQYTDDKYFKTGAVWEIGQVHNFSRSLAKKFFSYPCFEQADIDLAGDAYVSSAGIKPQEVAANINMQAMDADKLVHLARYEFNRVVDPAGKSVDQLRAEVRTLTVLHSLDLAEDDRNSNVIRKLTPDEFSALVGGLPEESRQAPGDTPADPMQEDAPEAPESVPEPQDGGGPGIEDMDKDELIAFALGSFGKKIDKRLGVESVRSKVAELMAQEDAPESGAGQ